MLTEAEAKKKWCLLPGNEGVHCVASECMAWRWLNQADPHEPNRKLGGGYCGLAGRP